LSYDVYLEIDTGGDCLATVAEIGNYTSNVSGMWAHALGCSLGTLDRMAATDAIPLLESAVAHMATHPEPYRAMEPDNGWGTYDGALGYLHKLLADCREHPKTTLRVSH